MPTAYLALSPSDAAALGTAEDRLVTLYMAGTTLRLPVRVRPRLPNGVAGVPAGLLKPNMASLPDWGRITAAGDQDGEAAEPS